MEQEYRSQKDEKWLAGQTGAKPGTSERKQEALDALNDMAEEAEARRQVEETKGRILDNLRKEKKAGSQDQGGKEMREAA